MGHALIFQLYNNPNTNQIKNNKKWVTEHKTKLLLCPFQSSDLNPVEMSEVNWREEAPSWSWESEGSGEILDEEWSLIVRCSLTSSGIIGYI